MIVCCSLNEIQTPETVMNHSARVFSETRVALQFLFPHKQSWQQKTVKGLCLTCWRSCSGCDVFVSELWLFSKWDLNPNVTDYPVKHAQV